MSWLGRKRRVRFIPQLEVAECGAASLAMVLDHHGCAVPLVDVRAACAVSRDGVSAARMVAAARGYGLDARGLRLEPEALKELPLPAILHWELNHFVVLERITRRGALLVDPARGRVRVSHAQLREAFTGVVLAFEPQAELPRVRRRAPSFERYRAVLAREKPALGYVLACALALQALELLLATSTQVLVDRVIEPQRDAWLVPFLAVLATATVVRQALQWLRDHVTVALQTALDLALTSGFVEHLLRLPLSFFEQRSAGDLMQRVEANDALREALLKVVLSGLDALLLLSYAALMLAYDLTLGALVLAVAAARMLVLQLASETLRQDADRLLTLTGGESAAVVEALAAPETLRAAGAESLMFQRCSARMGERLDADLALKRVSDGIGAATSLFDGLMLALVIGVGGSRVLDGQMTLGTFAGFMVLSRLVEGPLAALLGSFDRLLFARAILTRLDDVLAAAPEPDGSRTPAQTRGEIVFDKVSFRHGPSAPWLFRDLSFRVHPGEKVAIVGRSGQGKSTILKLLLGVVQPSAGRILLDGVDLRELSRGALARDVGVVLQEPFLLEESVAENLRLRVPDASLEALTRAAQLACVHDVVTALPHGYLTTLGHRGADLSGGQRQRLSIARAIVGKPALLLLDEATSSLDLETEARVHANLGKLGCTRLLIAHRLATVRDADRILLVEDGAIVQDGPYLELAICAGPFRDLMQAGAA